MLFSVGSGSGDGHGDPWGRAGRAGADSPYCGGTIAAAFYHVPVNAPAAPPPPKPFLPRVPDWVFAAGLGGSIFLLIIALLWRPHDGLFTEPAEDTATEGTSVSVPGSYVPLAEARPDAEPPAAEALAVEEFGYAATEDGYSVIWGASLANTHEEYGARFELLVTLTGAGTTKQERFSPLFGAELAPGGRVVAGGRSFIDAPSDMEAVIEVVNLSWFVFEGEEVPAPSLVTARLDSVEEASDGRDQRFAVTLTNDASYAQSPYLQAVFRSADGTLLGAGIAVQANSLPPGESTRTIEIREGDLPVGADPSLTAFVPAW